MKIEQTFGMVTRAVCGLFLLAGAASVASAQIAVTASLASTEVNALPSFSQAFTVPGGSNVLVVEYGERNSGSSPLPPASLSFTVGNSTQTLTQAVALDSAISPQRDVAIYYLVNPASGAGTVSGTVQSSNVSNASISVYSLSRVNTAIAPIVGSGEDSAAQNSTVTLNHIGQNSFAATAGMNNLTSSGSSVALGVLTPATATVTDNRLLDSQSEIDLGYVSGFSTTAVTFDFAVIGPSNQKLPLAVAVFTSQ